MPFPTSSGFRPGRLLMALVLALVATFSLVISAAANLPLLKLSTDPYTNTTSQHRTEVEPDTFAFGSTIVSAFQVGRFFDGGSSNIGFATSLDGGTTWTHGFLPGTTVNASPIGSYERVSDASVAFDAKHNVWIVSYLGLFPPTNPAAVDVLVSRSTDGGLTWGLPVVVNNDGHSNDKNWTVCDDTATSPFYGNCYTEFDDNTQHDLIQMTTSVDSGVTWAAAQSTANNAHGLGGQPVVQPTGTVIVPIVGFAGKNFLMLSFTSTTGGASWGKTHTVARIDFHTPAGGIRADIPLPSAEIDGTGTVYLVWSDCRFEPGCPASDLVLSTTSDGTQWSSVTRIPLEPIGSAVDHFIPGLAVDRSTTGGNAHLALSYYYYPNASCTTATCQLNVGTTTSADGGASWTSATKVAGPMALTWLPNTTQGLMVGDYMSTSFTGVAAYPVFARAMAPNGTIFNEAMDTVEGGLAVGTSVVAANDHAAPDTAVQQDASSVTAR